MPGSVFGTSLATRAGSSGGGDRLSLGVTGFFKGTEKDIGWCCEGNDRSGGGGGGGSEGGGGGEWRPYGAS